MFDPERPLEPKEPKEYYICKYCGQPICEGDDFVEFSPGRDFDYYHRDCFEEFAPEILLRYCGAVAGVAGEDDG